MYPIMDHNLSDLLARLAATSEALDDEQQRYHGYRAGAPGQVELSVQQARIKTLKREQAELRRLILACREWDNSALEGRAAS